MLHVRHALMNKSVPSSAKQQREIITFTVLMNTTIQPLIFSSVTVFTLTALRLIQWQGSSLTFVKMQTRWDNRKIVTVAQVFISKGRFSCRLRHHC